MDKTSLGDRMKGYEAVSRYSLINRMPVIIRLDGKAFHTWTKRLDVSDDPFNADMHQMMLATTVHLMMNIQNAAVAYTQSDEISILLNDWKKLNTDQWFGNGIQKMASVSSSLATTAFNFTAQMRGYITKLEHMANFDSRVFNIPREEVVNYFLWRQQDATRNSVQMLGRHHFSHKEMHLKNVSQVQDMLMLQHNVNWNDIDTWKKRGTCVTSDEIDEEIPIFSQDRQYIEKFLQADDD